MNPPESSADPADRNFIWHVVPSSSFAEMPIMAQRVRASQAEQAARAAASRPASTMNAIDGAVCHQCFKAKVSVHPLLSACLVTVTNACLNGEGVYPSVPARGAPLARRVCLSRTFLLGGAASLLVPSRRLFLQSLVLYQFISSSTHLTSGSSSLAP